MSSEIIGKLIPTIVLFVLGIIEALGGLYFDDKKTKNDYHPSVDYKEFKRQQLLYRLSF